MRVKHAFGILTMLSVTLLTVASCTKEPRLTPTGSRHIRCIVGLTETKASSISGDAPGTFISQRTIKGDSGFDLIETVYENNLPIDGPCTKGQQITDDRTSGATNIKTGGFVMAAYAEGQWHDNELRDGVQGSLSNPNPAGLYFKSDVTFDGSWSISGDPDWINGVPMTFWCWDKATDSRVAPSYTVGASPQVLVFNYSLPTPAASAPYADAVAQPDMVFSFNSEKRVYDKQGELDSSSSSGSRTDEYIDITFYHALSAVQFFVKDIPDGYRVSRISLKNVASSARFTVTGGSPLSFGLSEYGSAATYTQDYTSSDASLADRSAETSKNHPGDTKSFFMIPQTFNTGSGASLEITLASTDNSVVENILSFSLDGTEWTAGKYYVYKIDVAGNVEVEIGEQCSTTTKSNVCFTNTKNIAEYFRAAIVANWYDASGNIVASWNSEGTFSGLPGTGWTQGSDGFYYYSAPVPAGETTANLFDSFTLPSSAPVAGAHLEMTILVQAVAFTEGTTCMSSFAL